MCKVYVAAFKALTTMNRMPEKKKATAAASEHKLVPNSKQDHKGHTNAESNYDVSGEADESGADDSYTTRTPRKPIVNTILPPTKENGTCACLCWKVV